MRSRIVICCSEIGDPNWRWLEKPLSGAGVQFEFVRAAPRNLLERRMRPLNVARMRASLETVRAARREEAGAIVTHGPTLAAWCGFFARLLKTDVPIVAHSFNFSELPNFAKRKTFAWMLSRTQRFVVFSTFERDVYSELFHLPPERFDIVLWGVRPPTVDRPETAFETGDYVCAIGGNARDYATLTEAAAMLPWIRFVLVVRPENLAGLDIPPNITVHVNCSLGRTMNILMHSRFMALPLATHRTPCGHVTMVAAMHLKKAFIITNSAGVRDYVSDGYNCLVVPPRSAEHLAAATRRLWNDAALCRRLGGNGRRFARRECTEERIAAHFRGWLSGAGLIAA